MKAKHIFYLLVFCITTACNSSAVKDKSELEKVTGDVSPVAVSVYSLNKGDFKQQLISNGKIIANQQAILRFQTSAILKGLKIKNGQDIKKGDTLAILENGQNKINLQQTENAIAKARLDLLDELLLAGYKNLADTAKVAKNALDQYKTSSGLKQALLNHQKAIFDYNHTFLIAPFTGIIADLKKQAFDLIASNDEFCTLYNNQNLAVEFKLMEMEIGNVYMGQHITLHPFNNPDLELSANISEINPVVDENGLVSFKAKINQSKRGQLFTGLNMRIVIEHSIPNQYIVPKEAVVLRSNRNVVFCYQDGLSKWIYVEVLFENATSFAVSGDLKVGDQVIVSNNLNLAHDARVMLVEN